MGTALDRPAYDQTSTKRGASPANPSPEEISGDPRLAAAYSLGHGHGASGQAPISGIAPNPFAGASDPLTPATGVTLPRPAPTAASDAAPLPSAIAPPAPGLNVNGKPENPGGTSAEERLANATIAAQKPLVDEKARKSAGISVADAARANPANNPFDNGFFKPAAARANDLATSNNDRITAGRNVVKSILQNQGRTVGPTPPVGGTQAVLPAARPAPLGTRQPFIGTGNGVNQAADYAAGGQYSSAPAGSDPTLDANFVRGLPRKRVQTAAAPAARPFYATR